MTYRLTDRAFSRQWRRNKKYSEKEIRWIARRRRLRVTEHGTTLKVVDPRLNKTVANFGQVDDTDLEVDDINLKLDHTKHAKNLYAALKLKA